MKQVATFVGIDAHKKDLFVAMLIGAAQARARCARTAGRTRQDESARRPQVGRARRAGLLTVVQPPTPADEAVRDLARARDDAHEDRQRCRHRLGKLLLRRGRHYAGKTGRRRIGGGSTA